jgi:hypothetical protein
VSSWRLIDADPVALANKYTFYKPSRELIGKVRPGELVKLIFEFDSADPAAPRAERMWVRVTELQPPEGFIGTLDNDPRYIKDLAVGDRVTFQACNIINTEHHDDDDNLVNKYIRRCFVTKRVLDGEDPPGYVYREEPDRADDSGWRILAGNETDEFLDDPANSTYVSLGAVLGTDDSFVHLLESPVGSAFIRDRATGVFKLVADGS